MKQNIIGDPNTKYTAFIMHGYGSNYDDMSALAEEILQDNNLSRKLHFISLNAPYKWEGGFDNAYQWFSLISRDEKDVYKGLEDTRIMLEKYLQEYLDKTQKNWSDIILSGFSQGAMISLHTALRLENQIAGALCFSGTIIKRETLDTQLKSKPKICLIHGKDDEVLPYQCSELIHLEMQNHKVSSELHIFDHLSHAIDERCIKVAQKFLTKI